MKKMGEYRLIKKGLDSLNHDKMNNDSVIKFKTRRTKNE